MRRYHGETLRTAPRIAVVANDAIGNFVVGTPLLQMLRQRWNPVALDYYGGTRTWELIEASPLIDFGYPLHGAPIQRATEEIVDRLSDGSYDLVVNMEWTAYAKVIAGLLSGHETFVCGPSIGHGGRGELAFLDDERSALWKDQRWIAEDLTERYTFLQSGFIGEIFARLAFLEGEVPRYSLPMAPVSGACPDVLIATAASLPEKLWTRVGWQTVLRWMKERGLTVGLIGAPPAAQREFWQGESLEDDLVEDGLVEDFRGKFTLPEVVTALSKAKLVFTIDNGVLHLACGTETPTIGLFRHGIHRLWAPPSPHLKILTPGEDLPVSEVSIQSAVDALEEKLS